MTPYDLLRRYCGLSQAEAAGVHGVALDTVKQWCRGRRAAPPGAIADLRDLAETIETAAQAVLEQIDRPDGIEIGWCATDAEAQARGFPCAGAHAAALGQVIANVDCPVTLAPSKSSATALALAAPARERWSQGQSGRPLMADT